MARQSSTEVKLEFICEKISKLEKGQEELRADINRGKGAMGTSSDIRNNSWVL